jgi:hypothetical protein
MPIVAESRLGRRLIGRLERGVDVLEGIAEICRLHHVHTAELRGIGALEQVVLGEYDQRARGPRPPRRFDAAFEVLSLCGNVSEQSGKLHVQARVTLSRERDNGIELLGGALISGRVFALELVIEVFDDVVLRRLPDAQTGLHLWREAQGAESNGGEPAKIAHVPFEAPARTKWEDVIAASEDQNGSVANRPASASPAPAAPPPPALSATEIRAVAGDLLDHPKFGRCQIERIEGDYEFVSARMRNQRLIRLSLDVITLVPAGQEDGRQLFRAEPGSR